MAVKDGLPATDFSRMNREYIKTLIEESGGGSGGGVGLPDVTAADNGKILGVVNGEWGAMDAPGGGGGDESPIQMATVTINFGSIPNIKAVEFNAFISYPDNPNSSNVFPYAGTFVVGNSNDLSAAPELDSPITVDLPLYYGIGYITGVFTAHRAFDDGGDTYSGAVSLSGNAEMDINPDNGIKVTGDCTITITWGT